MKNPLVTVFMPVYNGQRYIRESVESILTQTFKDFELLIVDDASTDKSVRIIESFNDTRIRLVKNKKHLGLAKIRQKGVDLAKGKYIAFLDCDDIALPQRLSKHVSYLDSHKEVYVAGSWVEIIDEQGKKTGQVWRHAESPELIKAILLFRNCISQSSVLLRKECFNAEHYRADNWPAPDYDLWIRLAGKFKMINIPAVLTYYRKHPQNMSGDAKKEIDDCTTKIMKENLGRLDINVLPQEVRIHRLLEPGQQNLSLQEIKAIEKWLLKLSDCNRNIGRYDIDLFDRLLKGYWFKVCLGNSYNGMKVFERYRLSMLSRNTRWGIAKQFFLSLFCFFRKSRLVDITAYEMTKYFI
ncbi:glycosyltransferase [Patescibacteria group bacterium]|nr:glycosyltransferase [Patescibacteria group bacterium]